MARELLKRGATMMAMELSTRRDLIENADQRVFMRVDWEAYEALDRMREEKATPRITYLDGVVELMSPSNDHERIKSWIGHLVGQYCVARGILIQPVGSWTLKNKKKKAAGEPDECFIFAGGRVKGPIQKPLPDLVIEVVWTSGGLEKLEVYRRLGVREVWNWIEDVLTVHVLVNEAYERRERSEWLPELDLAFVLELLACETYNEAVKRMQTYAAGQTPPSP
jgi:Uma2 family endonuclease